jgi:hypothetical protein
VCHAPTAEPHDPHTFASFAWCSLTIESVIEVPDLTFALVSLPTRGREITQAYSLI